MLRLPNSVLWIGLTFGVLLVFVTPPFQVADEDSHFKHAYALSRGSFFAEQNAEGRLGYFFPAEFAAFEEAHRYMKGKTDAKYSFEKLHHWSLMSWMTDDQALFLPLWYSSAHAHPLLYCPQAIGVVVGRLLGNLFGNRSPLTLMHWGRLVNLICFWLLVYAAIKITPVAKSFIAVLAFMPMTFSLASSLSYDAPIIGVSLITIALLCRYAFSPEVARITKRDVLLCCLVSVVLAEMKSVYLPLFLLWFMIPRTKFSSRWAQFCSFFAILACGLGEYFVWRLVESRSWALPVVSEEVAFFKPQAYFIFAHPVSYLKILLNSIYEGRLFYLLSFIGSLGWLDTHLPFAFIGLYCLVLLGVATAGDDWQPRIMFWQRLCLLVGFFAIAAIIFTVTYIIWTSQPGVGGIGSLRIEGVQGRYLIPIGMLPGAALAGGLKICVPETLRVAGIAGVGVASAGLTILITMMRYY